MRRRRTPRRCQCHWEAWVSAAHSAPASQPIGQVGCLLADDPRTPPNSCCRVGGTSGEPWHSMLARSCLGCKGPHWSGGFEPPSWRELMMGARPEPCEPEEFEPGTTRDGWQHEAASHVEESFRAESLFPKMWDSRKALLRSQGAWRWSRPVDVPCQPADHVHFTAFPGRPVASIAPSSSPFRAQLPVCGLPLDSRGHHRAACARAGVLGGRGWAVENAAARICREAGGRVTTNVQVRDLDLAAPHVDDARRLKVVVDGSLGELSSCG